MKHLNISRLLIFIAIMVVLAVSLSVPAIAIYNNMKSITEEELAKSAMAISISVAKLIEQDLEPYKDLATSESYAPGSYDEEYYQKMLSIFQDLKQSTNVSYIYTEKRISDTETMYILDGEDPDSEFFSPLGSTDLIDEFKTKAYAEKKPGYSTLMDYKYWGELISGYAPLIDPATGEVISLVGTDITAEKVIVIFKNILMSIALSFLLLLVVLGLILYKILGITADTIETDYLTGLYSKRFFESHIRRIARHSKSKEDPFSIIMIDIDHFKSINDRYGHPFGDLVLRSVSDILRNHTRSIDKCSRCGGDEFMILLPGATEDTAAQIGERIRESISRHVLVSNRGETVPITVSIGIAQWHGSQTIDHVISNADLAMYESKNSGKDKVTIYKS